MKGIDAGKSRHGYAPQKRHGNWALAMFDRLLSGLIFLTILGSGLMAGLFFVFSVVIMSALGRIPAPSGIAAMQSINKVIINP
jgi:hypothetical protein